MRPVTRFDSQELTCAVQSMAKILNMTRPRLVHPEFTAETTDLIIPANRLSRCDRPATFRVRWNFEIKGEPPRVE